MSIRDLYASFDEKELRAQFEVDGYVVLRKFFAEDEMQKLLANLDRFVREVVPFLSRETVFYEDRNVASTLKQVQQLGQHDPWFDGLLLDGRLRSLAETLLSATVVPMNLQYFNKPPQIGLLTPPHQDGYYFKLEPSDAVTMWLALDEVDEENGCVRYVKGSHKRGMRDHARTQTLGFSQGIVDYPSEPDKKFEVAETAQPGDLLVHHALTIHRADGNHSHSRNRRALGFVYYSKNAREDTGARAAYQQKLAGEMKAAGKI